MGRKRQFDIEGALDAASKVFWAKGYDQATLTDLTDAMGIAPTSLYFAFESKEELFRRLLERYHALQIAHWDEAFRQSTLRDVVRYLLRGQVMVVTDPQHAPGCLSINSACPDLANDLLRKWLADHRSGLRLKLEARIAKERRAGSLPKQMSPAAVARFVASVASGIAIEAQSGATRQELYKMVDIALTAIPE